MYVNGSYEKVDNISKKWHEIKLPYDVFYNDKRFESYKQATALVKGNFTDLDDGRTTVVRFESEEDASLFKMRYDEHE